MRQVWNVSRIFKVAASYKYYYVFQKYNATRLIWSILYGQCWIIFGDKDRDLKFCIVITKDFLDEIEMVGVNRKPLPKLFFEVNKNIMQFL